MLIVTDGLERTPLSGNSSFINNVQSFWSTAKISTKFIEPLLYVFVF